MRNSEMHGEIERLKQALMNEKNKINVELEVQEESLKAKMSRSLKVCKEIFSFEKNITFKLLQVQAMFESAECSNNNTYHSLLQYIATLHLEQHSFALCLLQAKQPRSI